MNIYSDKPIMVFKDKKYEGKYFIGLTNKKQDGSYEKGYIRAVFKKGVELENQTLIKIKSGFLSFYKDKEGKTVHYPVVLDFEIVEQKESDPFKNFSEEIQITSEDLPF